MVLNLRKEDWAGRIRYAWVVPSYACNKSCDFCYNSQELLADTSRADIDTADRLIGVLNRLQLRHCTILGGEPLIYPHLRYLVDTILEADVKVSIVSNGLQLLRQPERFEWLIGGSDVESLQISLVPGEVRSEQWNDCRDELELPILGQFDGQVAHATAEEVVCGLSAFEALPIKYVIKLFKKSVDSVPELLRTIAGSKHRKVLVSFGTGVVYGSDDYSEHLLNPQELVDWYVRIEAVCQEIGVSPSFYMNLPICLFPREFLARVVPDARGTFGCSLLRGDSLVVDHKGMIAQCTHMLPISNDSVLNDSIDGLEIIRQSWEHGTAARSREALSVARHENCLDCAHFQTKCWGGCPILWSFFDPETFIGATQFQTRNKVL